MNTCRCCHFLIPAFLQSSRSIFVRHCYSCGVYQLSCCCCVCLLPRSCSCKVDSTISRNYDQFSNFRVMCVCESTSASTQGRSFHSCCELLPPVGPVWWIGAGTFKDCETRNMVYGWMEGEWRGKSGKWRVWVYTTKCRFGSNQRNSDGREQEQQQATGTRAVGVM